MKQDADGKLLPGAAIGFTVSDDGLVYRVTLRPKAVWSDGRPVTADGFVYAWRRAADPATASPHAWYMKLMQLENAGAIVAGEAAADTPDVTALDDHRLEVRLATALLYFAQMVTHTTTFPVPQCVIEANGDNWTEPGTLVSTGAYLLSEGVPPEKIVLTRNPLYWDNANTIIETVTVLIINDENQE